MGNDRLITPDVAERSHGDSDGAPLIVQPKLEVGSATDPLERDADRVADLVMRVLRSTGPTTADGVDGAIDGGDRRIRRATTGSVQDPAQGAVDSDTEARIRRASGGGARLAPELQRSMSRGFGADFSAVRIHHDGESDRLTRQLQARAFTTGSDVFFRGGEYRPDSTDGQRLVAHELAHVVQQSSAVRRSIRRMPADADRSESELSFRLHSDTERRTIRRSIAAPDPTVNSSGEWRKVIGLVSTYNASRDKAKRDKTASTLDTTLQSLIETMQASANRNPGPGIDARIRAARDVQQSIAADRARTDSANEDWMAAQGAARGNPAPGKLKINHLTQQTISDTMTNKALEDDWTQTQLEFDGLSGVNSRTGITKTRTELKVAVNIPFSGETGSLPVVKQAINKYWNTFKLVYKDSKGKGAPPVNREIQLEFVLGKSTAATMKRADGSEYAPVLDSHHQAGEAPQPPAPPGGNWVRMGGYEGNFAVEPSNDVLLWTGDHPKWKERVAPDFPEEDAKTRSDAANWRMNDPDVEEMIAHEFGHLIGLPDEYSKRHSDIVAITGQQPRSYQSDGQLPSAINKQYTQIAWAIEQTRVDPNNVHHITRSLNRLAGQDGLLSLLSAHHDKLTGRSLDRDLNQLAMEYQQKVREKSGKSARKQPNADYQKVWNAVAPFTQGAWEQVFREGFRSGGVMGDYHTVTGAGAGAPDARPNAAAHDHKHPLEPRHVKRFADALGAIRNETWEPAHR